MNYENTDTIVVLNDGSTFTSIEGCTIQVIDDDQIEELNNGGSPDNLAHHPLETFDMQDVLERSENKLRVFTGKRGVVSSYQLVDPVEAFLRLADALEDIRINFMTYDFNIHQSRHDTEKCTMMLTVADNQVIDEDQVEDVIDNFIKLFDVCSKAFLTAEDFRDNMGASQ